MKTEFKYKPGLYVLLLAMAFLVISPLTAGAYKYKERLNAGDKTPPIGSLDQYGSYQSLTTLSGDKGLILAFIRSVDWCPYCQDQVFNLSAYQDKFLEHGFNVAAISYDTSLLNASFAEEYEISMPILSDPDSTIIKGFGLLNRGYHETSKYFGVPHPAVYVIDKEGDVMAVFAEEGYKKRPDPEDILEYIKNLPESAGKTELPATE